MIRLVASLLAATLALPMAGCGSPASSPSSSSSSQLTVISASPTALNQPVIPDFPQMPLPPEGADADWDAYNAADDAYRQALGQFRKTGISQQTVQALNDFSLLTTPLVLAGQEGENAIYSPLSLWSALAMLTQCADHTSREQVLSALGTDGLDSLTEQVNQVWQGLYTDDGQRSLLLGNSIWLNSAVEGSYVPETLDTLAQAHHAGVFSVPMGTGEADQAITHWVSQQTKGLIGSDEPVLETTADTLAVLASSLYYKAAWMDEFSPGNTYPDTFTDVQGKENQVDFMHQNDSGDYLVGDNYRAARLSTTLGEMVFVLPDEGTSPEALLQQDGFLSQLDFSSDQVNHGQIQWSVPKFDVSSQLDLLPALKQMGITDLLNTHRADLSALTSIPAYLSQAQQLCRVKANEEGVEAAAVTLLVMDATDALVDDEPFVMDLDRPFLFLIRSEGVPLFIGVVNSVTP